MVWLIGVKLKTGSVTRYVTTSAAERLAVVVYPDINWHMISELVSVCFVAFSGECNKGIKRNNKDVHFSQNVYFNVIFKSTINLFS